MVNEKGQREEPESSIWTWESQKMLEKEWWKCGSSVWGDRGGAAHAGVCFKRDYVED